MADNNVKATLSQEAYQVAIDSLDTKLGQLQEYRSQYEKKKNEIKNFWTGEQATSAEQTIQDAIEKVDKAYETVSKNLDSLRNTKTKVAELQSSTQTELDEAQASVQALFN